VNDKPSPFADIFAAGDPEGLLATRKVSAEQSSEDAIAMAKFEAINAFIDQHKVLPGSTVNDREPDLYEFTLEADLDSFQGGTKYRTLLAPLDRHGLLGEPSATDAPAKTMAELIASGDPLLDDTANSIFELRHVSARANPPDEIAKRRPCEDFAKFAPIFERIAKDLASGRRITSPFEGEASVKPGRAFIFHGLVAYIADVDAIERRGKNYNARTRVIFANGTESNLLLRSFARALYDDELPRQIIEANPAATGPLFTGETVSESPEERLTGSIYVVESLSTDVAIAALRGRLFKIGFTTQQVEARLANVEADPTFLLAPVNIVTVFDTVNLNPGKLEKLLHQFFAHARLQVDVVLGRTVNPREWFVVPIDFIREAITRILDGTILDYRYDHLSRKIVHR
jgi:hypothetical protein